MAETNNTNTTVFNTKLVDLNRLSDFWNSAKQYILQAVALEVGMRENADTALQEQITANTTAIGVLNDTTIPDLESTIGGVSDRVTALEGVVNNNETGLVKQLADLKDNTIPALQDADDALNGRIDDLEDSIENLTGESLNAINNKLDELLNEETGKIVALETADANLQKAIKDLTDAVNEKDGELQDAIGGVSDSLDAHASETVSYEKTVGDTIITTTGGIHVTGDDRKKWDTAANRIDTFLEGENLNTTLDQLHEIQNWFDTHESTAQGYANAITTLEGRADNLEAADETINGRIDTLAQTVTDNKTALDNEDDRLEGLINGVSDRVATLENTTIPTLKTDLENADEALNKRIDDVLVEIENNEKTIAATLTDLDGRANKNAEDISSLTDTVDQLISDNSTAHNGFASAIEAIQELLNGMKLATKAEVEAIVVYP